MTITLKPEHAQWIAEALQTGAYQSPDEVVARALQMFHSEVEWFQGYKDSFDSKIERALAQFERGDCLSPEESHSDMEKRKADWLAQRRSA